jgi:hypothetical protein
MTMALLLEPGSDEGTTRFIVLSRENEFRPTLIENIYETDEPDDAWELLSEYYPDLSHVVLGTDFVEADCLSLREAVEAHYGGQYPVRVG